MPSTRLTDAACAKMLAKGGARTRFFDKLLPGLCLDVTPDGKRPDGARIDGARSFRVVYRVAGDPTRRKRWLSLGRYHGPARDGSKLTLDKARDEAREALAMAASGKDPIDARKIADGDAIELIIPAFVKRFLETGAKKNGQPHAPAYVSGAKRLLENHVIPRWRGRKVADITTAHVATLLTAIADEKPPIKGKRQKGGPIAARRTAAALSKFFNWCMGEGLRTDNPVAPANRPGHETRRNRYLTPDEIAILWPCMAALDTTRRKTKKSYSTIGAFPQLLLVSGQRIENVMGMKWANIKGDLWTIPRAEMKDANQERPDHVVPLSPLALDILKQCERIGPYVFQSTTRRGAERSTPAPISGDGPIKRRLDKIVAQACAKKGLAPIPHWTFHDCRRTASSLMEQELDISDRIIGAIQDHADGNVTEAHYLKGDLLRRKRAALNEWGQYLSGIVAPPKKGEKVVTLHPEMAHAG